MGQIASFSTPELIAALAVGIFAGFVKGAVGFAMPMLMIAGLGSFLSGEAALGALIFPTLATNLFQAFRQGWRAALATAQHYWRFLVMLILFLAVSAQFVRVLPETGFFLLLGVFVTGFALLLLSGLRFHVTEAARARVEVLVGALAGTIGGLSGVWGPPTVVYLAATGAEKRTAMRAQGVIYGVGSVVLLFAHLRSGVVNAQTAPLSALMLVPVGLGMVIGTWAHDRMAQETFRRAMLLVLVLAGLNLVRRGLTG